MLRIKKPRSSKDQRVVQIMITELEERAHTEADAEAFKTQLNITPEEVETLYGLLTKM